MIGFISSLFQLNGIFQLIQLQMIFVKKDHQVSFQRHWDKTEAKTNVQNLAKTNVQNFSQDKRKILTDNHNNKYKQSKTIKLKLHPNKQINEFDQQLVQCHSNIIHHHHYLKQATISIRNNSYQDALHNCLLAGLELDSIVNQSTNHKHKNWQIEGKQLKIECEKLEVDSLRSYCLINLNQIDEAIQLLQRCISAKPNHSLSHRRLGIAFQKDGKLEKALKQYKIAEMYQPQNTSLYKSIVKVETLIGQGMSATKQKQQVKQFSTATFVDSPKQHVTFGTSEVFQLMSQDSDEYFAHIKQQINKLNQIKPKKSILKCSKSLNKDSTSIASHHLSQNDQKIELEQLSVKKTLSMKSWKTESPAKWEEKQDITKEVEKTILPKKQKKKQKSVCFTVSKQQQQHQ